MGMHETVVLNKEEFHMQRAYMYALTIRDDCPQAVKELIEKIETRLAKEANVKSVFAESEVG